MRGLIELPGIWKASQPPRDSQDTQRGSIPRWPGPTAARRCRDHVRGSGRAPVPEVGQRGTTGPAAPPTSGPPRSSLESCRRRAPLPPASGARVHGEIARPAAQVNDERGRSAPIRASRSAKGRARSPEKHRYWPGSHMTAPFLDVEILSSLLNRHLDVKRYAGAMQDGREPGTGTRATSAARWRSRGPRSPTDRPAAGPTRAARRAAARRPATARRLTAKRPATARRLTAKRPATGTPAAAAACGMRWTIWSPRGAHSGPTSTWNRCRCSPGVPGWRGTSIWPGAHRFPSRA